jgi:peptidoglycan/xylan/chitin deacetylase (PgdA/CDA1 family)
MVRTITDPLSRPIGSVRGAKTTDRLIALTFDDGPDPVSTPLVLDELRRASTKATFFVLVDRAVTHPELIRRIVAEGHEIGLHGIDHHRLTTLPGVDVARRVIDGRRALEALIGAPVTLFRPPFGSQSLRTYLTIRAIGLRVVVWADDAEDWVDRPPAEVARRAMRGVAPGAILLLHDGLEGDPEGNPVVTSFDRGELVRLILAGLTAKDYEATSVSGLLAGREPHRTAWFRA